MGVVESEMGARISRSPGDGDAGSPGRIERGDHLGASGISGEGGAGSGPSCGREIDDGKGSDGGGNTFLAKKEKKRKLIFYIII